jgi:hypothetical protein
MMNANLQRKGVSPATASSNRFNQPSAARLVSRGRQVCVRPVNFREDGAEAQPTQGTDLAAKKAATKITVFSSGAPQQPGEGPRVQGQRHWCVNSCICSMPRLLCGFRKDCLLNLQSGSRCQDPWHSQASCVLHDWWRPVLLKAVHCCHLVSIAGLSVQPRMCASSWSSP